MNTVEIVHLTTAECWSLVEERSFGRLALEGLDAPRAAAFARQLERL